MASSGVRTEDGKLASWHAGAVSRANDIGSVARGRQEGAIVMAMHRLMLMPKLPRKPARGASHHLIKHVRVLGHFDPLLTQFGNLKLCLTCVQAN